jgi:hypothetical protein
LSAYIDIEGLGPRWDLLCLRARSSARVKGDSISMKAGSPFTRADDMPVYAGGVTIWHIYMGHLPFENIDEDDLDLLISEGLRPDLSVIVLDDEAVRALICK